MWTTWSKFEQWDGSVSNWLAPGDLCNLILLLSSTLAPRLEELQSLWNCVDSFADFGAFPECQHCAQPALSWVGSCIVLAAFAPLRYFCFLRVPFEIINPRANGSVKHWINSLLMLTHKNRGTLACASPAQECFLQCGRDLGALIGSICLTCLNAFLEVNICGLSLKFSNWFSSCAISCFIWACFVSLRKILLPSNSMLWSIPSSFLERRFCFVLFYRNSVTSVKCLTGLAALETGMLQLQERVCLHQHQPIHVPAGPWPSYCQAAALGESAVVVGFQQGCSKAIQLLPGTFCWIAALWWWSSPTWDLEYQVYRMVWDITRT